MFVSPISIPLRVGSAWIFGLVSVALLSAAGEPTKKSAAPEVKEKLSFNTHIQPILSENCYQCHGPDPGSRKDGLRLDRAEYAYAPHEKSGPAIIRGDAAKSPLVLRIESRDEKEMMPPPEAHKTLKPAEIALLRRWIAEGAEYQEHWAFIAPQRPAVPAVAPTSPSAGWAHTPIDAFILARLAKAQLAPSPEADRRTLIRRVSFDLTGLAPSPAEVEAFVHDTAPGAYERVVDRLLASPRYGEHRARYWLDYVRYADTHGLHFDNYRSIWPYRDYVIRAFNANKPFDRFVREQLAGDLQPARTIDELTATGFVRNSITTNEGGTITEEVTVALTRDRVEAFGGTFLGLTTGCAACHDHKFDPISQKDFYTLSAFLNNTADQAWDLNVADPVPVFRLPSDENRAAVEAALAARAGLQTRLAARQRAVDEAFRQWLATGARPRTVSPQNLELRLRFDEGRGEVIRNTAPGAATAAFTANTNPLVWGEESWLWPSARFDINTQLPLGNIGDVEVDQSFSAGGWVKPRDKPGGRNPVTGSLFSRVASTDRGGRGWEITYERDFFAVNIVQDNNPAALAYRQVSPTPLTPSFFAQQAQRFPSPLLVSQKPTQYAIQLIAKNKYPREWTHLFVTYDGSGRAAGVRLFIDGQPVETQVKSDSLQPGLTIRTQGITHLGRRVGSQPMPFRETRYQDIRFYRRALSPAEVARLQYEEIAAEILARQPNPARWSSDERFVALDKFFLAERDPESKQITAKLDTIDEQIDKLTAGGTPTLITRERSSPAYAAILKRGVFTERLERVEPATPHFLPPLPAGASRDRLGLAEWLVSAEQPLTARVTVNRMWQEIFGRGLVETSEDFGVMGARPTHPELLDWLAVEFRESGWDMKKMYRLLVLSAVYRQSAVVTPDRLAKDPGNRLLARGPRFRLDGEMIRDAALQASGLLVEKIGGAPVKPYQPAGVWEEIAMLGSTTGIYKEDEGSSLYRRSVYTLWKRAAPPASMETFDAPSREVVCIRRPRSNTPLQALVTMNDPQFVEAARKLAERAVQAAPTSEGRLDFLAQTVLSRSLDARELAVFAKAQSRYRTFFQAHADDAIALLQVGRSPMAALDPAELAEWTLVSSQFFNLDEFLTK